MYKIKKLPEDFIVKEINNIEIKDEGKYQYWILKKRNYTTTKALQTISKALNIPIKWIGFAGNKDKKAITEQLISIKGITKKRIENLKLQDIKLIYVGRGDKPITVGYLQGNKFKITVRNLTEKEVLALKKLPKKIIMPNSFGKQRFSKNNIEVGKAILKREFKRAINYIDNQEIKSFLIAQPNNYIGALRLLPKSILRMYIHSYQSYIFNAVLKKLKTKLTKDTKIPLVGFSTEYKDKRIKKIIKGLLNKDNITERSFILPEIPEISSEGMLRKAFVEVNDLTINIKKDELNNKRFKAILSFNLPKGSYATTLIEYIFQELIHTH